MTTPDAACWCCGEPAPIRGEGDPWEGQLDGYCESCASTRCDTTDSTCAVKRSAARRSRRFMTERPAVAESAALSFDWSWCAGIITATWRDFGLQFWTVTW